MDAQPVGQSDDDRKVASVVAADDNRKPAVDNDAKTVAEPAGKRYGGVASNGKSKAGPTGPRSQQSRAGLQFPVGRIHRYVRNRHIGRRISAKYAVFMAAAFEYLTVEMMELAGNAAKTDKKSTITPKHIQQAVRGDDELNGLFKNVTFAAAGRQPHIEPALLPKPVVVAAKPKPKKRKTAEPSTDIEPTAKKRPVDS